MSPLMNFVSDNEDQFIPPELKQFSSNLKLAKKIGEAGKSIDICQGKKDFSAFIQFINYLIDN